MLLVIFSRTSPLAKVESSSAVADFKLCTFGLNGERERSGCSSLLLQVENEEAGLKQVSKLGMECPLVTAHPDSRSIHRGQGSKDCRNKQPSQLLLLQSNEK